MTEEKCPICPNHCLKNELKCGRGKRYFSGSSNEEKPKNINEAVILDLRKIGHFLHHEKNVNPNDVLSSFSSDELSKLHRLLSKINTN